MYGFYNVTFGIHTFRNYTFKSVVVDKHGYYLKARHFCISWNNNKKKSSKLKSSMLFQMIKQMFLQKNVYFLKRFTSLLLTMFALALCTLVLMSQGWKKFHQKTNTKKIIFDISLNYDCSCLYSSCTIKFWLRRERLFSI